MQTAGVIAFQAAVMFILLLCGYFMYKFKFLSDETTKQLSNIVITIVYPIVIVNAYLTDFDPAKLKGLLWSLGLSFLAHIVLIIGSVIAVRKGRKNYETERLAVVYTNCGFMGIPLVSSVFGNEGVFFLTGYITIMNIFMWTHGVVVMNGGEKKPVKETVRELVKILLSPAILSVVIGLFFFFSGIKLPEIITQPLDYLGALNTPLAMIVSGATIAKAGLKQAFAHKRIYFVQAAKLVIIPLALAPILAVMELFGADHIVTSTVLMIAAAPTASATIMFAYRFGKDENYASHHFALSTVASILTMPLVMVVGEWISGVITQYGV